MYAPQQRNKTKHTHVFKPVGFTQTGRMDRSSQKHRQTTGARAPGGPINKQTVNNKGNFQQTTAKHRNEQSGTTTFRFFT